MVTTAPAALAPPPVAPIAPISPLLAPVPARIAVAPGALTLPLVIQPTGTNWLQRGVVKEFRKQSQQKR